MKFPELNEQATLIKAGKPYALYTQDTYMEFHHLICELLKSFTTAVKGLLASHNKSADPTQGSQACKDSLNHTMAFGYALLQLVSGFGSQCYFQNIASVLDDHHWVELSRVVDADWRRNMMMILLPFGDNEKCFMAQNVGDVDDDQ